MFLKSKKDFIEKIDANYGVWNSEEVEAFFYEIRKQGNEIKTYKQLFEYIGIGKLFKTDQDIDTFIKKCIKLSLD